MLKVRYARNCTSTWSDDKNLELDLLLKYKESLGILGANEYSFAYRRDVNCGKRVDNGRKSHLVAPSAPSLCTHACCPSNQKLESDSLPFESGLALMTCLDQQNAVKMKFQYIHGSGIKSLAASALEYVLFWHIPLRALSHHLKSSGYSSKKRCVEGTLSDYPAKSSLRVTPVSATIWHNYVRVPQDRIDQLSRDNSPNHGEK